MKPQTHSRAVTNWRTKLVEEDSERATDVAVEIDDSDWSSVDVGISEGLLTPGQSAVYRAWIDIPAGDLKINKSIVLGRIDDDGIVYINGQRVGESHDFSTVQRFSISRLPAAGEKFDRGICPQSGRTRWSEPWGGDRGRCSRPESRLGDFWTNPRESPESGGGPIWTIPPGGQ